jgi:hypothetical protein
VSYKYQECSIIHTNAIISILKEHLVGSPIEEFDMCGLRNPHMFNTGYKELWELSNDEAFNVVGGLV